MPHRRFAGRLTDGLSGCLTGRLLRTSCSLLALSFAGPRIARAADATLESAALRLEVTSNPYHYQVVEKATSMVLLAHTGCSLGGSATGVTTTATTLDADLGGGAHVKFTFTRPEVLQVRLSSGAKQIGEQFADHQEHVYGLWEYPAGGLGIDNRGISRSLTSFGGGAGSNFTNARAPFFLTSRRYGIYVESAQLGSYAIAAGGKTSFTFDDSPLTYDVIYGPGYYDIFARFTAIAGGPLLLPLWALDTMWWEDDFHADTHNAKNAQENVLDLANQLQAHKIAASSICIDRPYGTGNQGWGNSDFDGSFPDPKQMVADLRPRASTSCCGSRTARGTAWAPRAAPRVTCSAAMARPST